jgi:hypothetical protein
MTGTRSGTRRRALLLAVAALITAAAALAIAILLFGDFGGTEGRVLVTTLLLALCGALSVPAAVLWDQRRLTALAAAAAALAALAAALNVVAVWTEPGEGFGKVVATAWLFLVPTVVATALAARPLHRLFAAFAVLSAVVVAMATAAIWAGLESSGYLRLLGALVVLDVLVIALQPLLLRAGRERSPRELRLVDASGARVEVSVTADSLADAVARALREAEREGRDVRSVEVLEPLAR